MTDGSSCCSSVDTDLIINNWLTLAALAFKGALDAGRGCLIVTATEEGLQFLYLDASPCPCHAAWVDEYNPAKEAIICVRRPCGEQMYRFEGQLTPEQAYEHASADMLQETVQ